MDRRRFHLPKEGLTESFSTSQSKSLLENTFKELNSLYEADEEPKDQKSAESEKEDKAVSDISKLAAAVDQVEVPEKNIK